MEDVFSLADALGPHKVIHVYEPSIGLKAVSHSHVGQSLRSRVSFTANVRFWSPGKPFTDVSRTSLYTT